MFSLICVWTNGWVNNRDAGDLSHHRLHYDVTVMWQFNATHSVSCYWNYHLGKVSPILLYIGGRKMHFTLLKNQFIAQFVRIDFRTNSDKSWYVPKSPFFLMHILMLFQGQQREGMPMAPIVYSPFSSKIAKTITAESAAFLQPPGVPPRLTGTLTDYGATV